jgi:outer membrane protein assembly factor BamB
VLWFTQDIFTKITGNDGGVIYAMPYTRDSLRAIDIIKGTTKWEVELPLERGGGADSLLADQNTVFVVTSVFIDAYEIATGKLKWFTRLGGGHVPIVSQLDSAVVRVYYGDKLYEIDSETGKILTTLPKDATAWISDNIVFQISPTYQVIALDRQSGEILWSNNHGFYIDEGQEPINISKDKLLVGLDNGICALNLRTGEDSWCRPEVDISKIAIDYQTGLGYGMRKDLVLLTIDLQTGNVLGETSFLSSQPIDEQIGSVSSIAFSDGILVVSFSDSGQTFGLSLKQ